MRIQAKNFLSHYFMVKTTKRERKGFYTGEERVLHRRDTTQFEEIKEDTSIEVISKLKNRD